MAAPTPIAIDAPLPSTVKRQYSFTDFSQNNPTTPPLGNRMDAEYDRINVALNKVISFCSEVKQLAPAVTGVAVAGADTAALEYDYAAVAQAWAEYMPDTIPPNTLAVMNITGDHWSSRWWAHQALTIVQLLADGTLPPPTPPYADVGGSVTLPPAAVGDINIRNVTNAPITVTLPSTPVLGQHLFLKDCLGNAGTYPITISGPIDGNPSYLLMSNYASLDIYWIGSQWGTR